MKGNSQLRVGELSVESRHTPPPFFLSTLNSIALNFPPPPPTSFELVLTDGVKSVSVEL